MNSEASCKKTSKLVKKGVLYCAPFLLLAAAITLASVWAFQTFIAGSTYFDALVSEAPILPPQGDLFKPIESDVNTEDYPFSSAPGTTAPYTDEEGEDPPPPVPDTFPVIEYGSQWAKINVEGWKRRKIPLIFGDKDTLLKKGACMSMKSSFCGQGGRTIISAHVNSYFYELQDIEEGDIITIDTVYGRYRYEVIDIFIFDYQNDRMLFEAHAGEKNILFMYTCYPRRNAYAFKQYRLAVIGKMIEGKDWSVE